jgi:hypothetical protein
MRTFRAKAQARATVSHCLSSLASATIRGMAATTVSIFRVENDPQQFVWLGDGGVDHDFARLAPRSIVEWLRPNLAAPTTERRLCLVEECHRGLPASYQIWSVEIDAADDRGVDTVDDVRAARVDTRLIGISLYQTIDDPRVFVLFLGLARGVTPSGVGFSAARLGRASVAGTLSPVIDLCPLTRGAARAPFPAWIREGVARTGKVARIYRCPRSTS